MLKDINLLLHSSFFILLFVLLLIVRDNIGEWEEVSEFQL